MRCRVTVVMIAALAAAGCRDPAGPAEPPPWYVGQFVFARAEPPSIILEACGLKFCGFAVCSTGVRYSWNEGCTNCGADIFCRSYPHEAHKNVSGTVQPVGRWELAFAHEPWAGMTFNSGSDLLLSMPWREWTWRLYMARKS
jgi:hypothetical protein